MMKHTPGPWYASNIGLGPHGKGPYTWPLGVDPEEAAANARLIAAAPDLLALCRAVAGSLNEDSETARDAWHEKMDIARAILARIEEGEW